MVCLWQLLPRTCATARPQLAKADTAFQAHPLVNRLCLAVRRVFEASEEAGRPITCAGEVRPWRTPSALAHEVNFSCFDAAP